jgi:hypothetical protein
MEHPFVAIVIHTVESLSDGMLNISGDAQDASGGATGDRVSAGDGDSGGPMVLDGDLIGVASAGGTSGIFGGGVASYIDLQTAESKAFLAKFKF